MRFDEWNGFCEGDWCENINVQEFILKNYSEYKGSDEFLMPISDRSKTLLEKYELLHEQEKQRGGVLDIDADNVTSLLTYKAGYLDRDNEVIVGFQTDAPLKRGVNPFGGLRMAQQSCHAYGVELSQKILDQFKFRTTHNDGVFRVYTKEIKKLRKSGVITGLPDAYGRGRIIGDYRRVALYGVDFLVEKKRKDYENLDNEDMTEEIIRLREELFRQIDFLNKLKEMAMLYNHDISRPAKTFCEAVQWTYYGYLAAIKEQNGAAMSLGRVSTFLDIYAERDLKSGRITEQDAQEIIDQFVLKLRMARQLRTPEYDELFAGDPTWVTEAVAGMSPDGRSFVTKNSFRLLHTLYNLSPSPEPNITVLWSKDLPESFKNYCVKVSIETSSIQYESDDVMRPLFGTDYGIACCVSAMRIGKQMQYFGARCNLPKVLLLAINGGKNEMTGEQLAPAGKQMSGLLDYETVMAEFRAYMDWLCKQYVKAMNIIHYMHDKYAYEKIQMALHDTEVERLMAFGLAGLSVAADSLSAIKYANVTANLNKEGFADSFIIEGDFPKFGNDDERVDSIARELVEYFSNSLKKNKLYRNAQHTLSLLTITSNVVYGKKTGATPDGRLSGEPFAPGANPMHHRDCSGAAASLNSVASIPYCNCLDGISNTFSITDKTLGKSEDERIDNLRNILDGYFGNGAHHLNVNVFSRENLLDAQKHPEKYPNLTIRVSGYAVRFNSLNREQQDEVLKRTFF